MDRPLRCTGDPRDRAWSYAPGPTGSSNLWNLWTLPRRLRAPRPTLHHATLNFQAPLGAGCPLVVTMHDLIPLEHPDLATPRHRLLARLLVRPAVRAAARVIVDSAEVRERVARRYPWSTDKLRVVHCGLPDELLDTPSPLDSAAMLAQLRKRLPIPERFLLFIGPPEPRKNLAVLIRALLELEASVPDVPKLVLVGRTSQSSADLDRLKIAASRHTIDLGHVTDGDLAALRRTARGLLFPSRAEGFGYPPREALAAGTPAVVSSLPVLQEVLGEHVDDCPVDAPSAWARAMLALDAMTDAERRARRAAGLAHARTFTPLRLAQQTWEVYREVIGTEAIRTPPGSE